MKTKYFPILLVVVALALITSISFAASTNQIIFAGSGIPRFKQPLPILDLAGGPIATVDGTQPAEIHLCEFWANVLPKGTFAAGVQPKTRVWGYIKDSCPANGPDDPALDSYLGPVMLAPTAHTTTLTFINDLGTTETTQVLAYKNSTDQTLALG